jgi:hypothetical protein
MKLYAKISSLFNLGPQQPLYVSQSWSEDSSPKMSSDWDLFNAGIICILRENVICSAFKVKDPARG